MVFLAATGAIGIGAADGTDDTGTVFVGIYLILFAGIQFFYEIAQMCPGKSLDMIMKKNFGFLYGEVGKGCYLML